MVEHNKNTDKVLAGKYLKRAWKHILSTAVLGNKRRAATVFFIGIFTTIVQMAAMLTLVMAARTYENKGQFEFASFKMDLTPGTDGNIFIWAVAAALFILLLSVFIGLYQQIIITRIGRRFFEETLDDTRWRLRDMAAKGTLYHEAGFMRMLQRDSRYLSISYMRTLNLLQPGLLVVVFLAYAVSVMPIAAGVLAAGCLFMIPAHIYMSKWSAKTSEDIQAAAKLKSEEERNYIGAVSSDPFALDWDDTYNFSKRPLGENGFITAFVSRQRIGAYSQFITDTAMTLIVILLVVMLARKGSEAVLPLSSIMILLILFRLVMGYVSKFAQAVTMVSSYEPFFRELLNLYSDDEANIDVKLTGDLRRPVKLAAFQTTVLSRADGQLYAHALGLEGPAQFVSAHYSAAGRGAAILKASDDEIAKTFTYDPQLVKTLTDYKSNDAKELSDREKYLAAYLAALQEPESLILCSGDMWDKLSKNDLQFIVSAAKGRHFVLVYLRPPGKLVLPLRFQVAVRTKGNVDILCTVDAYRENRKQIINELQKDRLAKSSASIPISADEIDTF